MTDPTPLDLDAARRAGSVAALADLMQTASVATREMSKPDAWRHVAGAALDALIEAEDNLTRAALREAQAEVERLRDEAVLWDSEFMRVGKERADALNGASALRTAHAALVAELRALHQEDEYGNCTECLNDPEMEPERGDFAGTVCWPCPTIQTVDRHAPDTAALRAAATESLESAYSVAVSLHPATVRALCDAADALGHVLGLCDASEASAAEYRADLPAWKAHDVVTPLLTTEQVRAAITDALVTP